MKLLTIIFSILPFIGFSQSFQELIKQYEKECSQIVNDTIEQTGTINYQIVPVVDKDGKILHYALGKADTVWQAPECPTFKFPKQLGYSFRVTTGSSLTITSAAMNYPIWSTEKAEKTQIAITRKYVCQVKLREVEPFSEHFWEWIKKYNK